jgi:plasmid stabilization system protein ParE
MRRRVAWSADALDDLGDVLEFAAEADPAYARKLVDGIEAAGNKLGLYATGRPGRVPHTYEKSLPELRYIIAYEIEEQPGVLNILRVIHTAREWLPGTWPRQAATKPR